MNVRAGLLLATLLGSSPFTTPPLARGDEGWPQFRGPRSAGFLDTADLPESWNATENIVWKTPVPGRGWSSPIVWGDRVFLTSALSVGEEEAAKKGLYLGGDRSKPSGNAHRWMVYCLGLEAGKLLWEREAHAGVPPKPRHIKNSYASETPCTDGKALYAYFGNVGLFAYDLDGKPLWSRSWPAAKVRAGWGTAASPIVHDGRVIIVNDNEEGSFIESLDARTGETVWRRERDEKSNWSTPFLWRTAARTEIVTPGTGKVRAYGLDGALLWELRGMSSITIPTPVGTPDLLYVSSGFVVDPLRPIYAIRPGASGDISLAEGKASNAHIEWSLPEAAPYNPSPLLYRGQLYVLLDRGYLASHDAKTGKRLYDPQRIDPAARAFTASPWAAGGKVFCLSEDGDTFVIEAGTTFRVLGKNGLGEMCLSTPAILPGGLLIRTESSLYRIGTKQSGG